MRYLAGLAMLFVSIAAFSQQPVPQQQTPHLLNQDVVAMLRAGLTPEIVIAKIESSKCDFDTSPATLLQVLF